MQTGLTGSKVDFHTKVVAHGTDYDTLPQQVLFCNEPASFHIPVPLYVLSKELADLASIAMLGSFCSFHPCVGQKSTPLTTNDKIKTKDRALATTNSSPSDNPLNRCQPAETVIYSSPDLTTGDAYNKLRSTRRV